MMAAGMRRRLHTFFSRSDRCLISVSNCFELVANWPSSFCERERVSVKAGIMALGPSSLTFKSLRANTVLPVVSFSLSSSLFFSSIFAMYCRSRRK